MKRGLKRHGGEKITVMHYRISGNMSVITGGVSDIYGYVPGIYGDVLGIRGGVSSICGDVDYCRITDEERENGIDINDLIESEE